MLTRGGGGTKIPKIKLTSFVNGPLSVIDKQARAVSVEVVGGQKFNTHKIQSLAKKIEAA